MDDKETEIRITYKFIKELYVLYQKLKKFAKLDLLPVFINSAFISLNLLGSNLNPINLTNFRPYHINGIFSVSVIKNTFPPG